MNALLDVVDAIARHFGVVALGVSVVLAIGGVAVLCARRPLERRRLGGLCVGAAALYLVVALVPLPRWTPEPLEVAPVVDGNARLAALLAATADLAAVPTPTPVPFGSAMPGPIVPGAGEVAQVPVVEAGVGAEVAAPWPWGRIAVGCWLVLAATMALRALVGFTGLARLLRAGRPVADELLAGIEVARGVRVRCVARTVRPFCAWWGRPVVVVPASLLAPGRRSQLRSVLRHELAHVRAGDPTLQLLLAALAVPLAAHPLFWWLARDVRFHAELLADDAAAAATGRERYARDLLDLAERAEPELAAAGTVPVFHRPSEFFRRIQMLLQREGRLSAPVSLVRRSVQTLAAFAVVGFAAATLGVPAVAQEPKRHELKVQNDELRAQLDALRAELATLRAMLDEHKVQQGQGSPEQSARGRYLEAVRATMQERLHPDSHAPQPEPSSATPAAPSAPNRDGAGRLYLGAGGHVYTQPGEVAPGSSMTEPLGAAPPSTAGQVPSGEPQPAADPDSRNVDEAMRELIRLALANHGDASQARVRELLHAAGLAKSGDVPAAADAGQPGAPASTEPAIELPEPYRKYYEAYLKRMRRPGSLVGDSAVPVPDAQPSPRASVSADGIAELVSRCLDLKGDLELAEMEAVETKAQHEAGVVTALENKRVQLKLTTLQRKYAAVRVLVRGEIEATQQEVEVLAAQADQPGKAAQLARAKTRLEALQAAN